MKLPTFGPTLNDFAYRHRWLYVAMPSVAIGVMMIVACVAKDWHAPALPVALILVAGAIGLGAVGGRAMLALGSELTRREIESLSVVRVRSVAKGSLALGIVLALACAGVATTIAYFALADAPRVAASLFAGAYVAAVNALAATMVVLAARPVVVGVDGVRIGTRMLRWSELRAVGISGSSLVFVGHDDTSVTASFTSPHLAAAIQDRALTRIESAADAPALLDRKGRSAEAWRQELTSPMYRKGQLSPDDAERIVASGSATHDERVGAAIVLAHASRADRVRVVAESVVEPRLRVALEKAAAETLDDDTLNALGLDESPVRKNSSHAKLS